MNSGIYTIYNKINGKLYVGSSSQLKKRIRQHLSDLKANRHKNQHLQRAYNKYGGDNFEIIIIAFVPENEILYYEQNLIDMLGIENLYNISPTVSSLKGWKPSDETRALWSKQRTGVKQSKESRLAARKTYKDNGGNKNKIAVLQIDAATNQCIREWDSAYTASKELNIQRSKITAVCKGKRKITGNYKWKYK